MAKPLRDEREELIELDTLPKDDDVLVPVNGNSRKAYHKTREKDDNPPCGSRARKGFEYMTRQEAHWKWNYPCRECYPDIADEVFG